MDPESRIKELGLELPPSVPPCGVYEQILLTLDTFLAMVLLLVTISLSLAVLETIYP